MLSLPACLAGLQALWYGTCQSKRVTSLRTAGLPPPLLLGSLLCTRRWAPGDTGSVSAASMGVRRAVFTCDRALAHTCTLTCATRQAPRPHACHCACMLFSGALNASWGLRAPQGAAYARTVPVRLTLYHQRSSPLPLLPFLAKTTWTRLTRTLTTGPLTHLI